MRSKSKVGRNLLYKSRIKRECVTPERFSRRIRNLPPVLQISLEDMLKKIKQEKHEQNKPVFSYKSSYTTVFTRRSRKLKYPISSIGSKEVVSLLSPPKWKRPRSRYLKQCCGDLQKDAQASFEVQIGSNAAIPRMVLRRQQKPAHANSLYTVPKTSSSSNSNIVEKRKKYVLDILNTGSLRELKKLHTVGSKTAERILIYRHLKGSFHSISDLANMPDFYVIKFRKFLRQNFLKQ